ncbi:hypothetical protein [Shimia thalassica]|uniref:hypothetical protein n=1 Tax=Shimia thalassica TaxID=1715693 RepID=UPI003D663B22
MNLVPDKATLLYEFRHLAEDHPDEIKEELQLVAEKVTVEFPAPSEISLQALAGYPGLSVAASDPVISLDQSWWPSPGAVATRPTLPLARKPVLFPDLAFQPSCAGRAPWLDRATSRMSSFPCSS